MMQTKQHHYTVHTVWSGATAGATRDYRSFSREHSIEVEGKAPLKASADPSFRGDAGLHNPEDMLGLRARGGPASRARQCMLPLRGKSSRKIAGPGSGSGGGERPTPRVRCRGASRPP